LDKVRGVEKEQGSFAEAGSEPPPHYGHDSAKSPRRGGQQDAGRQERLTAMSRNPAEKLVRQKAEDARGTPAETSGPMAWPSPEPEELSPLDRTTLDEQVTQKFWEPRRRDKD
jgi:hypothetical protein